jgi:twitching motility protein PilT
MQVVLQAAETGHLVLSTLHTSSAAETVERIINMFPPHEKEHMCMRLAASLKGVVSQKLVPTADGNGRVAAVEIMVVTPTIAKLIEDGHFGQLSAAITEGEYWGMQTINQCLVKFVKKGWVTEDMACINAGNLTELKQMLRR